MIHSSSVIVIKENDIRKTDLLFKAFRYFDLKNDQQFATASDTINYLSENFIRLVEEDDVVLRGLWSDQHYIYLYDPEITDVTDEDALEDLAKKLNTDIYVFVIQEVSRIYEFAWYNGKGQARYFSLAGKSIFNDGARLPEEQGIDINENIGATDIIQLAINLGIDLEFKNITGPFTVKQLGYHEDL